MREDEEIEGAGKEAVCSDPNLGIPANQYVGKSALGCLTKMTDNDNKNNGNYVMEILMSNGAGKRKFSVPKEEFEKTLKPNMLVGPCSMSVYNKLLISAFRNTLMDS